jgi:imidazolonepropionase-like amidohydrolase
VALLVAAPALAEGLAPSTCDRSPIVITGASVLTTTGLLANHEVIVAEGRIQSVAPPGRQARPAGARIIDGRGHTLVPGLIDAHAHFFEMGGPPPLQVALQPRRHAFPINGRQLLSSGVTSVRTHLFDLEDGPAFKREADDDCHPAPRVHLAGPGFFGGNPGLARQQVWGVKGLADIRDKVARVRAAGAEWIAVHDLTRFEAGELDALVDEARGAGLRIMAAGDRPAEVARALDVGVDSLEYIDRTPAPRYSEELLARIKQRGDVYLVPPIGYYHRYRAFRTDPRLADDPSLTEFMPRDMAAQVLAALREKLRSPPPSWEEPASFDSLPVKFRQLVDAGLPVVVGSDCGSPTQFHIDAIWWELETWRRLGVPAADAVRAATARAAALLRAPDVGRLEPGARGDFVLVHGNLADGGLHLGRVRAVAKGGVLFVKDGRWVGP